ncbi:MAG: glycosyltransferase family 4 protein [Bacteroidota bacterium]
MNILIISPKVPYPPIDGGAIASLSLAKSLERAGNKITLLAANTSKHKVNTKDIPEDIHRKLNIHIVDIDTDINLNDALVNLLFSSLPYNGIRFYQKNFTQALSSILRTEKFDIIQLEGLYMGLYYDDIRKISDVPIVMRSHNVEHIIWERNSFFEKNFFKKIYYQILSKRIGRFEEKMIKKLDAYIPITEHDANIFRKISSKTPIHVAVAGIDPKTIDEKIKTSCNSVFFIGALDWIPNQEGIKWFVDKVWPGVYSKFPDKKLHIAGRNAPDWLIKFFLKPGIIFHGEIPDAKKYMTEHGIMIVPLFAGSGMRIKILEGMSLGLSIITTSIGVEGINAKDDEEVIIANTANNFIEKICYVLENPDICRNIGKRAMSFVVQNYDNDRIANSLTHFYKSIIK